MGPAVSVPEPVEGPALALEGIHHVHSRHGLAARMVSVGRRVTDDVLEEILEHKLGLVIHEAGDALHATTAGQTADGTLANALVANHLAVALDSARAEALAARAPSGKAQGAVRGRRRVVLGLDHDDDGLGNCQEDAKMDKWLSRRLALAARTHPPWVGPRPQETLLSPC